MDHRYIEEHSVVSRHLMGKLSARERAEFEEHFLDCAQCLDQLEIGEDFRCALKQVAGEDARQVRHTAPAGPSRWLARFSAWQQAAVLAAAGLVVAAVPTALFMGQARRANQALDQRTASRDRRPEQARRAEASGDFSSLPAVASVLVLETARSAGPGAAEPVNQFTIPASPHWIVLSMDLGGEPQIQSYRAGIADRDGRAIWSKSDILPASPDTLALSLHSSMFHTGDYAVTLEALTRDGRYVPAGRYPFHITVSR